MEMHEMLKICLLALESRQYHGYALEATEELLGCPGIGKEVWTPAQMLKLLRACAPHLLLVPAHLKISQGDSAIYLSDRSEKVPVFRVYREEFH